MLPQEKAATRVTEARSWRVLCSQSAATVHATSAVAESVRHSTPDAPFGHALYAVVLRARAVREPTLEARCASGRVRSSLPFVVRLTARLGKVVPLQWRLRAARFWLRMIAFVSSRWARRAEGCREACLLIFWAGVEIFLAFQSVVLYCI